MNNSKKPIVVCLFGFMAVGKLTIAQKLNQKIKIILFHNHMLNDFLGNIFPRGSKSRGYLINKHRLEIVEGMAESGISTVMTHAYSSNYISKQGITDLEYVEKMEFLVEKHDGIFYGIHLIARDEIILSRIANESRTQFNKLVDPVLAKKALKETGKQESPKLKHLLKIDTGENTPEESVQEILDFIKQKQA